PQSELQGKVRKAPRPPARLDIFDSFVVVCSFVPDPQRNLAASSFFTFRVRHRSVFNHTLPVGRQLAQSGQLGGGRDVAKLAAFKGGAGERLRRETQLFAVGLRLPEEVA